MGSFWGEQVPEGRPQPRASRGLPAGGQRHLGTSPRAPLLTRRLQPRVQCRARGEVGKNGVRRAGGALWPGSDCCSEAGFMFSIYQAASVAGCLGRRNEKSNYSQGRFLPESLSF